MTEPISEPSPQEALLPAAGRAGGSPRPGGKPGGKGARQPAERLPVARVLIDSPLPHLDRPFDYLVPAALDADAVPGCRVRVRFAGQPADGYLLERVARSDHPGRLAFLERVVSPLPVLTPEIAGLARAVADRYAGTMSDVLRLAIPPRHARVEAEPGSPAPRAAEAPAPPDWRTPGDGWDAYPAGPSFLRALAEGRSPRAVWTALPGIGPDGPSWPLAVASAVRATLAGGRGAVVVVPDGKDVAMMARALGATPHVAITADLGPAERYRRWLKLLRGEVRVAVGTRPVAFAPVHPLGLAVIWDDGDDLHAERHAPYPHTREVLTLRAHRARAGLLVGGYARTAEAALLVASGWAHPLVPARGELRARAPLIRPAGDDAELARDEAARAARLPTVAWQALKRGLERGPVLVQVPRRGYLPALACLRCRAPARCGGPAQGSGAPGSGPVCSGPLALRGGHAAPYCRWCGRIAGDWRCPRCGCPRVRAIVVGARRTAEELGRAFPSVAVKTSGRDGVLATVGAGPALVVATPGAEPVPEGGYAAAVLLDGWALLGRPDLRAAEETLRRWMNAAALARPRAEIVVCADGAVPVVQALVRWDPVTFSERELGERAELGFPPAARMASLTGPGAAVREMLAETDLPEDAQVLGPVPIDGGLERAVIRVPRRSGAALARALKAASGARSVRKATDVVRVQVDPLDLI
ncbi:primosomal protein N' [Thermobispora bispora]|uniref:Probable replication restart protein PriA n=1 Tax=Thermobispora bispora (strain ATCC 19993 / DSM 43833 / CBS 139.67 / JCM 10125 / KCTC 9307 / NBRC 14880 / R51) TaxID=469371 RepID=D6Y9G2_THEBD|nr:primosomal protein N' [Thermobispora bispora]ADG88082.1 Primosomal protein N' (replication factor Y) - superfamily II helicase-like protein [Thermobispora bispora DSM 43833]